MKLSYLVLTDSTRTVLSVRFEVGVSLLLAPVGADKRGPKAPFPLVEIVGNTAGDLQESTRRSSGGSQVLLKALSPYSPKLLPPCPPPLIWTRVNKKGFFLSSDVVMHQTVLTAVVQHLSWMHCVQDMCWWQRFLSRNIRYKSQRAIWNIVTIRLLMLTVVIAIGVLSTHLCSSNGSQTKLLTTMEHLQLYM